MCKLSFPGQGGPGGKASHTHGPTSVQSMGRPGRTHTWGWPPRVSLDSYTHGLLCYSAAFVLIAPAPGAFKSWGNVGASPVHAEAARATSSSSPWKVISSWSSHGACWFIQLCPPQANIIPQKETPSFWLPVAA